MIFFAGPHAAGKSHAAAIFKRRGYMTFETGPVVRETYRRLTDGDQSFAEWIHFQEASQGVDFTNRIVLDAVRPCHISAVIRCREVVIVGNRSLSGIRFLVNHLEIGRAWRIVYFHAPFHLLHRRWVEREGHQISYFDFELLLAADRVMGVEDILPAAHHHVYNNGDLGQFNDQVNDLWAQVTSRLLDPVNYHG